MSFLDFFQSPQQKEEPAPSEKSRPGRLESSRHWLGQCSLAGFTLIEIVVVLGITVALTGIFLGYSRTSERQLVLFRDRALVIGTINRARALAFEKFSNPDACAFGVHFPGSSSEREFVLFQDLADCGGAARGTYAANKEYDAGEEIERFTLDARLQFMVISPNGLDVLFIPPEVSVEAFSGGTSQDFPVNIRIENMADGNASTIELGQGGQITITSE